jgi:prepilin-type N-terminal cleavage/methylation domain-containing protein
MRHFLMNERTRCTGFTLIELLTVVAILSVLLALLLPLLQQAHFQAVRARCIGERRQNYVSLALFVGDHRGLVPHPVGDVWWRHSIAHCDRYKWTGRNRYGNDDEIDRMVPWIARKNIALGHSNGLYRHGGCQTQMLPALGAMVAFGYVDSPGVLFCPSFRRPESPSLPRSLRGSQWYIDHDPEVWEALTDGDGEVPVHEVSPPGPHILSAGIVHYFSYGGPSSTGTRSFDRNTTLESYARMWRHDSRVSPIMFSCANGYARMPFLPRVWETGHLAPYGVSHGTRGMNAVMYEGSARWVTKEEVKAHGRAYGNHPDYMTNVRERFDNAQAWARRHATVAPPTPSSL